MRILVNGAGIAGAVFARAVARRLPEATLCLVERQPAFGDQGAGIVLGANAMAVLGALGLDRAIEAAGRPVGRMVVAEADGRALQVMDPREVVPERAAVAVHRSDLHTVLAEGLAVRFGVGVAALREHGGRVEVTLDDGSEAAWDLVVGADGIGSVVRSLLPGPAPARRYAGYTCWRLVVDDPVGIDEVIELWGPGRRAGLVPIGPAHRPRVYCFLVETAPPGSPAIPTDRTALATRFADFDPRVGAVIAALPAHAPLLHHDIEELTETTWGAGRVVLIGDAAHALTPNLGQGAGMAIEDAWVLAELLAAHGTADLPARLAAARGDRVRTVVDTSRMLGRVAHWRSGWARWLRNRLVAATPASVGRRQQAELLRGGPVPVGGQ